MRLKIRIGVQTIEFLVQHVHTYFMFWLLLQLQKLNVKVFSFCFDFVAFAVAVLPSTPVSIENYTKSNFTNYFGL